MGVIGNIVGGIFGSNAAKSAADTQSQAAEQASANAMAQYQQTRADLLPYNQIGQQSDEQLASLEGLNGSGNQASALSSAGLSGLTFQPTQAQLAATPGYQWNLAQGEQGVANSNAAQGRGISGAALKGAANYATGLASTTLGQQQQIFQQNLANVINPLQSLTTTGAGAAGTAGAQGVQATQNANQALVGGANAQAAGQVGSAQAFTNALNGAGSSLNSALLLNTGF